MTEIAPDDTLAGNFIPTLPENYTRQSMHRDFRKTFSTDEGRRVLGHIQRMAGLMAVLPSFEGKSATESLLMHEGRRMLALQIMLHISGCQGVTDEKVKYGGIKR